MASRSKKPAAAAAPQTAPVSSKTAKENVQPTAQDDVPEFASLDQAVKAYEALLQSHRQLQQIRQTEPERLLKDFIRAAERERTASTDVQKALTTQCESLTAQSVQTKADHKALEAKLAAANGQVAAMKEEMAKLQVLADQAQASAMDEIKAQLAFFQQLTGVTFSVHDLPPPKKSNKGAAYPVRQFAIDHKGNNGQLAYKLVQRSDDMFDYIFTSKNLNKGVVLPDYLGEDIEFEKAQLAVFFWQILDILCKEN